jgi:hypothetical protein
MQAADGNFYVVKFQGNPQGTSVLANEMLAAKLATLLGLPVPSTEVVELAPDLSEELHFETPTGREHIHPGLHLGSRVVVTSVEGRSYDCLPKSSHYLIRRPDDLVGIQLFDIWTCNRDTRQSIFWRYSREKKYAVTFIDNGHCFGGPERRFNDVLLPAVNTLSDRLTRVAWLLWAQRIATFPIRRFESVAADKLPSEWGASRNDVARICKELSIRQAAIAEAVLRWNRYNTECISVKHEGIEQCQVLRKFAKQSS